MKAVKTTAARTVATRYTQYMHKYEKCCWENKKN